MISKENYTIIVHDLKKVFNIYNKPIDRIKEIFTNSKKVYADKFIALQGINFKVKKGEFIGIIGKNGAGKSTLLKILSGELSTTEGHVEVNGTVSLLQLGIGFNKELSGIENIKFALKLNGHLKKDIKDIVHKVAEFADIGEFINRPVKYYSSGMYSRLSFAVGINIEPDILIVDEILAVGDLRFASKCLRKMHEFKEKGKTVLIVTHDTNKVSVFCDRAIWINDGKMQGIGEASSVIKKYRDYMLFGETAKTTDQNKPDKANKTKYTEIKKGPFLNKIEWKSLDDLSIIQKGPVIITHAAIHNKKSGKLCFSYVPNEHMLLYLRVRSEEEVEDLSVGWMLLDKNSMVALHSNSKFCNKSIPRISRQSIIECCFEIQIPPLRHSEYILSFGLKSRNELIFKVNDVFPIQIIKMNDRWRQGGYVIVENEKFFLEEREI